MGRYLESWDDAQSRGSSRNGGRGGEAEVQDLSFNRTSYIITIRRKHSGYDVESTVCCILPVHLLLTKFTQGVHAYFNTTTQTDASHVHTFILSSTSLNHSSVCNLVAQLAYQALERELSLVSLVKFQPEFFLVVFFFLSGAFDAIKKTRKDCFRLS